MPCQAFLYLRVLHASSMLAAIHRLWFLSPERNYLRSIRIQIRYNAMNIKRKWNCDFFFALLLHHVWWCHCNNCTSQLTGNNWKEKEIVSMERTENWVPYLAQIPLRGAQHRELELKRETKQNKKEFLRKNPFTAKYLFYLSWAQKVFIRKQPKTKNVKQYQYTLTTGIQHCSETYIIFTSFAGSR